jgi:hypothetical protein
LFFTSEGRAQQTPGVSPKPGICIFSVADGGREMNRLLRLGRVGAARAIWSCARTRWLFKVQSKQQKPGTGNTQSGSLGSLAAIRDRTTADLKGSDSANSVAGLQKNAGEAKSTENVLTEKSPPPPPRHRPPSFPPTSIPPPSTIRTYLSPFHSLLRRPAVCQKATEHSTQQPQDQPFRAKEMAA